MHNQADHIGSIVSGYLGALAKLGRPAEARAEFERAATMTENTRERKLLMERAAACGVRSVS